MARKLLPAQLLDLELAYDGYDPAWIIGTHSDPLPHWSYGPYAAAAEYVLHASQYQTHSENSYRGYFHYNDPHRRMPLPGYYGRGPAAHQIIVPGPVPGPVVKASKVVPVPSVTTILYPHGQGHNLGTGHGYKNIVVMRIPYCCEGCVDKWKDRLLDIPGFQGVNVDKRHGGMVMRATVFGDMDTHSVVKAIQKAQPRAQLWSGVLR